MTRALVVVPTFNEVDNIGELLRGLHEFAPDVDVLVVDDSSPDGTADAARAIARERPDNVSVLVRAEKNGLAAAYAEGFAWGFARGYDVLVSMDADLSHRPADVPRLIAAVIGDVDMVIGSRYVTGGSIPDWSASRRFMSRWGNRYANFCLDLGVHDATSGFRAYRASFLAAQDATLAGGYGFLIERAYRARIAGAHIVEVPIQFVDRTAGESKMSTAIAFETFRLVTRWGLGRIRRRGKPPRYR
jgi:dolichol-phosphate mannosyltransferase